MEVNTEKQIIDVSLSKRQLDFINAEADEVLFGGAAGGGKTFGQAVDTFLYAMQYPGSRQIIFRTTFPELERTLIKLCLDIYPSNMYEYGDAKKVGRFKNGSVVWFAYLKEDKNVYDHKSSEYDVIRFDELTQFSEFAYDFMISRIRGANNFPKSVRSSTNPGEAGHIWVKERFVDIGEPDKVHTVKVRGDETRTRMFIPSLLDDNPALMKSDPDYAKRLSGLPDKEYMALRFGVWDIFEGQYFSCWDKDKHVIKPFHIPEQWPRYFAMDYGLDMLAGYWIAVDYDGRSYVYREIHEPNLVIKQAAEKIISLTPPGEIIQQYIAPPDMWNRSSDTGKSKAELFYENGITLNRAANDRVDGWYALNNELLPRETVYGDMKPNLVFFDTCKEVIRCIPMLVRSKINPNDVSKTPHDITHAPDAMRYYVAARTSAPDLPGFDEEAADPVQNIITFGWESADIDIYI